MDILLTSLFSLPLFSYFCQDVHAIQLDQSKVRSGHDLDNPDTFLYQQVTYIKFCQFPTRTQKLMNNIKLTFIHNSNVNMTDRKRDRLKK